LCLKSLAIALDVDCGEVPLRFVGGRIAVWMFRMSSWLYFLLAPAVLACAVFLYFDLEGDEAAKAKALAHKPPEPVAIESYDPAKNRSDFEEVTVLAQLDLATIVEVVESKRGVERSRTTVGRLYPVGAKDKNAPAPAVLATHDGLSDVQISTMAAGTGPIGPILKINGREDGRGGIALDADKALESGPPVAEARLYIQPFVNGREAGLAKKGGAGGVLGLGAVAAALLGFYGWWRRRKEQRQKALEAEMASYG
jgi:hypothetical protein